VSSNPFFELAVRNTVIFTGLSLFGQTAFGILSAVVLNQEHLPARSFFRGVCLFSWIIPELIVAATFLMIFGNNVSVVNHWLEQLGLVRIGWLNDPQIALYTLVLVNTWKGLPYNIIVYLTALQGINQEYYEAARLDGANAWQQFWALTFPFLMPTILSTLILGTIWTSNVFFLPLLMTNGGPLNSTMIWSLAIFRTIFENLQLSRGSAMSVIVYLILLSIGFVYYRFLRGVHQEGEG
jgi:multiple sugar transport system permease protein